GRERVVEARLEEDLHLDLATRAADTAVDLVVGREFLPALERWHEVGDLHHAARIRVERRDQNVRRWQVTLRRSVRGRGRDAEAAALLVVQDRSEETR